MRTTCSIWLLVLAFMASPGFAGDRVIARVGSEAITNQELMQTLAQNTDISRQRALDLLIERRLVLVWASGMDISVEDEELEQVVASIRERNDLTAEQFEQALQARGDSIAAFRAGLREQLIINKAMRLALSPRFNIKEDEIVELYQRTYPRETVFEVSHILFTAGGDAAPRDEAAAERAAERVLSEILDGASFESMAREHSQDPSSADEGGRLGIFREGELLPELEELVKTLEPGEVGGPVKSSAGYHLLKLLSRELSEPPPLAEVRGALEAELMETKQESVRNAWFEELRETTYVEVFPGDG